MTSRIARIAFDALPRHDAQFAEACVPGLPVVSPRPAPSFVSYLRQKLLSDEQLAGQLQAGHADALTVLFERHSPRLFTIARRILRNDAEAEDTVQTIFIDAYRSIHQFNPEKGEFKTWLLLFAYQRAFNRRRHLYASRFFSTEPLDVLDEFLPEVLGVYTVAQLWTNSEFGASQYVNQGAFTRTTFRLNARAFEPPALELHSSLDLDAYLPSAKLDLRPNIPRFHLLQDSAE
jgi:RNA polymerase sigma factor (sigma-70 family)